MKVYKKMQENLEHFDENINPMAKSYIPQYVLGATEMINKYMPLVLQEELDKKRLLDALKEITEHLDWRASIQGSLGTVEDFQKINKELIKEMEEKE